MKTYRGFARRRRVLGRFGAETLCFVLLILVFGGTLAAADFGLVLSPTGEYVSDTAGEGAGFTAAFTPWFSAALGQTMGLYLSGKAGVEYEYEHGAWAEPALVELERTELNFRPRQTVYLTLGRQRFKDSGEMIASGLFDGLSGSFGLGGPRLSLGAFYTGLLYKKTAKILMTPGDEEFYSRPLDYGDADTYFASRRVLVSAGFEIADMASRLSLALDALAQFDVNRYENDTPLHSQYLEARLDVDAADTLRFGLTGIGALAEREDEDARANFAGAFSLEWDLPGALPDMLSAELRWGGGAVDDRVGPFLPVSALSQGTVFTPALTGLMNLRAAYKARPHRTVSCSGEAVVFWRTDLETFRDAELDGASKDRFLGTELSGALVWAFQSALRFTAGAGVFFPGAAFAETAEIRWKISGGLILSL